MAHKISAIGRVGIGGVVHERLLLLCEIVQDVGAVYCEQRTQNVGAIVKTHPRKATNTSAANEVEQEGFDIVVGMMRHGRRSGVLRKPSIAQTTGGHFNAFPSAAGFGEGVEMLHLKRHIPLLTEAAHKGFVAIALLPSEVEVAMQGGDRDAQFLQHQEQRHRVGTTAQRTKKPLRLCRFKMRGKRKGDIFCKRRHKRKKGLVGHRTRHAESAHSLSNGIECGGRCFAEMFCRCFTVDGVDIDLFGLNAAKGFEPR